MRGAKGVGLMLGLVATVVLAAPLASGRAAAQGDSGTGQIRAATRGAAATCGGIPVYMAGSARVSAQPRVQGNAVHVEGQVSFRGISGQVQEAGVEYYARGMAPFSVDGTLIGGYAAELTVPQEFWLTGYAQLPDLKVRAQLHLVVKADGQVSAYLDQFETICP